MADDPHAIALLALLDPIPQAVYDGKVPDPIPPITSPWVVAYFSTRYIGNDRLPNESKRAISRAYLHCVGGSASATRKVAAAVRSVLLDVKPVIVGRTCNRIRHDDDQPPRPDEKLGPLYMTQVEVYRLDTEPA